MQITSLAALHIPANRQRQSFDPVHIQELADSICSVGLLNPPVLRKPLPEEEASTPPGSLIIVAGETRTKAIALLAELGQSFKYNGQEFSDGQFPYSMLSDLDPLAAEEAELDENLKRRDLTWQEKAAAIARLDALRRKQKGDLHTMTALVQELTDGNSGGSAFQAIRESLTVARHLDDKDVAKASSAKEAVKILKKKELARKAAGKAAEFRHEHILTQHRLFNEDCLSWMRGQLADEFGRRFDVILTDPPYGMGAHGFGDSAGRATNLEHRYDDSYESWKLLMQEWAPLTYEIAKSQAHLYAFCDIDRFAELRDLLRQAGWYVFRTPLIYFKTDDGRVPLPKTGPRRQWEAICYAIKGDRPVNNIFPDVIQATADKNIGHGAQKPVACYQNLLQRSVLPGDEVLDCFAGSGTIFEACQRMQCVAVGLELDTVSYGIAASRLEALV